MDAGPVSARGKTAGRETLAINPVDAQSRGIGDGEVVRVFNARGACFAGVSVTETVRRGIVRLFCGAGYDPAGGRGRAGPCPRQSQCSDGATMSHRG
jgi:biotin/methionine sulfoxide reductase